jgi:hypothetical protein
MSSSGTSTSSSTGGAALPPPFGDCDGDDIEETPLQFNSQHCGQCNRTVDIFDHAIGYCDRGQIKIATCLPGWKLDQGGAGCTECDAYLGGIDVPDNGIDEDCTGGDATASEERGFFVDPINGIDNTGRGTKAAPFKSFVGVMDYGWPDAPAKREIYLAAGTYTDSLISGDGAVVLGGYSPTDWSRSLDRTLTTVQVSGTVFDFHRANTTETGKFVIDGLVALANAGTTRTAVAYSGYSEVYVQNARLEASGGTNYCHAILQDFPSNAPVHGALGLFDVVIAGCWPKVASVTLNWDAAGETDSTFTADRVTATDGAIPHRMTVIGATQKVTRSQLGEYTAQYATDALLATVSAEKVIQYPPANPYPPHKLRLYRSTTSLIACGSNSISADSEAYDSHFGPQVGGYGSFRGAHGGSVQIGRDAQNHDQIGGAQQLENVTIATSAGGSVCAERIVDSVVHSASGSKFTSLLSNGSSIFERNIVDGPITFNGFLDVRNNLFVTSGSVAAVAVEQSWSLSDLVFANNTVVSTSTGDCSLVSVKSGSNFRGLRLFNNILACSGTGTTRVGVVELGTTQDVTGLMNNLFAGMTALMSAEGGTLVTSLTTLNSLADIDAGMRGGNRRVAEFSEAQFRNEAPWLYELQATSPAIDFGMDASGATYGSVAQDLRGFNRPCGTAYDIGAFEYCP